MRKEGANKGQVYILVAVVIIGLVIAFATAINYSKRKNQIEIYNLGEELGTESVNILEYGTYNKLNNTQMKELLVSFINEFSRYGDIERLYFIFGDLDEITFVGYHDDILVDTISVLTNGTDTDIRIPSINGTNPVIEDFYPSRDPDVTVTVEQTNYDFILRSGENFYFIMFQKVGEERHVIQGGNRIEE